MRACDVTCATYQPDVCHMRTSGDEETDMTKSGLISHDIKIFALQEAIVQSLAVYK